MKSISVVTPCYNEGKNVEELYRRVKEVLHPLGYPHEHIFIDNSSTDNTVPILKNIAREDRRVKIIVNAKNFGSLRSPFYGMLQAKGDAVIMIFADLQDPPETLTEFIKKWEEGYKMVLGVKIRSMESSFMYRVRSLYYGLYKLLSENEVVEHCTGFGLYDKTIIEVFRRLDEPYPYLKSLISEVGFDKAIVKYTQEKRKRGASSISLYRLYDAALSGITSDSRVLIRIATICGFAASVVSFFMAFAYVLLKIFLWKRFQLGIASIAFGVFFFASVQLFFIGLIGEYVGAILTQVKKRPLVIEKERINF